MESEQQTPEQPPQLISAGTLIDMAWRHYRQLFRDFAPISAMLLVVVTLQQIAVHSPSLLLSSVGVIAGIILTLFGYLTLLLIITRNRDEEFRPRDIYRKSFERMWPYIIITILSSVIMVGGGVLLFIPALILNVLLAFAPFAFALEHKRGMDALAESWYYVRRRWWPVALRMLVYIVFLGIMYVAISFVFLIGKIPLTGLAGVLQPNTKSIDEIILMNAFEAFFTVPFSIAYMYALYASLRLTRTAPLDTELEKGIKKKLSLFAGIGLVVILAGSIIVSVLVYKGETVSPVLQGNYINLLVK